MNRIGIALLATAALLLASTAYAQEQNQQGQTEFTLYGAMQDGQFVWLGEDEQEVNPDLEVPPNAEITVTIIQHESSMGIPHNIQVGEEEESEFITETGDTLDYTFTSPESGELTYVCTIHPGTMLGTVRVAGNDTEPGGNQTGDGDGDGGPAETTDDTPGPGIVAVALATAGAALVIGRRRS